MEFGMTSKHERIRNFNEAATVSNGVVMTLGSTAETVLAATEEDDRIRVLVSVRGFDAWIRLMPSADEPTERKGIFIVKDSPPFEIVRDNSYLGEISIINASGGQKPIYYVTVY